jgi:ABC-type multidrug transport system fused ATPase/permease subunit
MATIVRCLKVFGGVLCILLLTLLTGAANLGEVGIQFFTVKWGDDRLAKGDQYERYLWLILWIVLARSVLNYLRGILCLGVLVKSSRRIHSNMLFKIVHAKLGEYLQRTSAGQIINRFTRDMDKIDVTLGQIMSSFVIAITLVLFDFAILVWGAKNYLLIPFCFVFVWISVRIQRRYMKLKRELTRLQSITSSPIVGWSIGVLQSCPEVRGLRKESYVRRIFRNYIDENTKNSVLIFSLDAWFEIRVAIANLFIVQIPAYLSVFWKLNANDGSLDLTQLILFLLGSSRLSQDLTYLLNTTS